MNRPAGKFSAASVVLAVWLGIASCTAPGTTLTATAVVSAVPTMVVEATGETPSTETAPPTEAPTLEPTPLQSEILPALTDGPRAIILFIGDGMGVYQRMAAQWQAAGPDGMLAMDDMPVLGYQMTGAANNPLTDSAAAATALATGHKTNYLSVGVDRDGNALETILERAKAAGWATGLVTTTQITHATPAAFGAHVRNRDLPLEIAVQLLDGDVDVLLGGGEDDFLPPDSEACFGTGGVRGDGRNLVAEAQAAGFTYVCSAEQLLALDWFNTTRVLGLFANQGMLAPYTPTLEDMTRAAIGMLSQDEDGFFLMVEGGQIDWAGHENDAEKAIADTLGLNDAVLAAQAFTLERPNTLIIVTADHETGGMGLNLDGSGGYKTDGPFNMPDGVPFWVSWEQNSHTAQDVPVTAQGPFSDLLAGTYENTFIYYVMKGFLDWGE
jgi:alkaline phosphatase